MNHDDPVSPDERQGLVRRLSDVAEQLVLHNIRLGSEYLRPYNLTSPQALVMRVLDRFGPDLEMLRVAEYGGISPSSVTSIMDRLVSRGLVERHTPPQDRRRVTASITDTGKAMLEELDRHQDASLAWLAEEFSPTELRLLIRLVERWDARTAEELSSRHR